MKLATPGRPHLTYCSNIHPGESWVEVRANLERYLPAVRERAAPGRRFGVGLRLSARAAEELSRGEALAELREFLRERRLYVFTVNGFPYGRFHGEPVKQAVYLPDWLDERRLAYTDRLAAILAALLPADDAGLEGSVSTVPGAFRARVAGAAEEARMVELLLRHAATLHGIAGRSGRTIVLALEPEPCCHLETAAEAVRFFEDRLYAPAALARFSSLTGLDRARGEVVLRRHLGVCLDVCHMAVEFEDPRESLDALTAAGIPIGKIQLSTGLRASFDGARGEAVARLGEFADAVYLHQVVERRAGGALRRFVDLPQALDALAAETGESAVDGGAGADVHRNDASERLAASVAQRLRARAARAQATGGGDAREWRVHFHVPLFQRDLGAFGNTQEQLEEVLSLLRDRAYTRHLEVETYTWDVLPERYRRDDIVTAVARELSWVLERLPA